MIKGKSYNKLTGSRAQVWHNTAYKTSGNLTKKNLVKNKSGRIVSRKKFVSASREKRLLKHGYGAKKGRFGAVRVGTKHRKRGGMMPLGYAPVSGMANDSMSTDALQLEAGMAGGRRRSRRRRSRRGGMMPLGYAPVSGMADDSMSTDALQLEAGMAGGRRRSRRRRSRRGGMQPLGYAPVSGMANDSMSTDALQLEAGMAGGRRRRRRHR
jgi:hypothetical protein